MKKKFYTNVVAIIAGAISAFLTSLILWPIVKVIFENFFHLFGEVSENAWKDDLIVSITIMLWFFISSLVGGVICTLFDANKGWGVLIISMALIILILIILTKGDIFPNPLLESIFAYAYDPTWIYRGPLDWNENKS